MADTNNKAGLSARLDGLHPIEGVQAVAPTRAGSGMAGAALSIADLVGDPVDAKAFENAGWTFVKAAQDGAKAGYHDVVMDSDGSLKILSDALNVKFVPAATRPMVEGILRQYGLSLRRDFGFSPNLFLVDNAGGDAISKAKSLNMMDDVVYAEPTFIEAIGGR